MQYHPSDYQRYATEYMLKRTHAGCFLQMGLGKTVITLTVVQALLETGDLSRALVIAPLNVARTVWQEEAEKWDHTRGIRCSKILGTASEREKAICADADLYIVNRENVPWLVKWHKEHGNRWPYDTIIVDELSSFKSQKAARFKELCKTLKAARRVYGLTGTPAPNGLIDLWPQIYLLDQGERLGRTITEYRTRYFYPIIQSGYTVYKYGLRQGAADEIQQKLSDICMSMTSQDWLKLPEVIYRDITVPLDRKARKAYDEMEKDMLIRLEDDQDITAANAATVAGKLLQLASGAVYDDEKKVHVFHDAKLDALKEIVEVATTPVLVFYGYRHEVDRIRHAIPEAVPLKGADEVERWNRGEIPVLIAHPDSAGHGLNLQAGGHIIVWFTLTWSLEKYQQACARLWRRGQQSTVIIHHLIAEGTIDSRVLDVLHDKDTNQSRLIQAVKARRDEVLQQKS